MKIIEKYSSIRLTNYTSCNSYTAFILLRRKPIYYSFSFCQWQNHSWSAVRYSFYKFFLTSKLCVKLFKMGHSCLTVTKIPKARAKFLVYMPLFPCISTIWWTYVINVILVILVIFVICVILVIFVIKIVI